MAEAWRVLIHGASGRMGQALLRLAAADPGLQVVAAVQRQVPAQRVLDGVAYFAHQELAGVPAFDVLVDFSQPAAFDAVLALARERGSALVSGTTGLSGAQRAALDEASTQIPLLWASNFSIGVALLHRLVQQAARALPGWDCDIIEMHHAQKQDAPSGTALTLGEAVQAAGGSPRHAVIRAGDIVGEHRVQFCGLGERLELVHRAGHRDLFARGALQCARELVGRGPGRYQVSDLIAITATD